MKKFMGIILAILLFTGLAFGQDTWIDGKQVWSTPIVLAPMITDPDSDGGTIDGAVLGASKTNIQKGPAAITTFAGTVTATASTTVTFSSAADAILAGYNATNPVLGTTLISNALTRYIVSWTNATTCVVDTAVTWAGTAITSVQLPIATFVNSAGVTQGWMNAAGNVYFVGSQGIGTASPTALLDVKGSGTGHVMIGPWLAAASYGAISFNGSLSTDASLYGTAGGNTFVNRGTGADIVFSENNASQVIIKTGGNILTGGLTAAGTSAAKNLVIGEGTLATATVANSTHLASADYLGTAGDNRLHITGEASATAKSVLGSGKVSITGTTGGFTRQLAEATSGALSGATGSIAVNVPSGARILGIQLRVDTAITSDNATKTWAADYVNTPTTAITSGQIFDANTKFNAIHPAYEITTGTVTVTITAAAGLFTGGVVRGIVYYEAIDNMQDAA